MGVFRSLFLFSKDAAGQMLPAKTLLHSDSLHILPLGIFGAQSSVFPLLSAGQVRCIRRKHLIFLLMNAG